MNIHSPNDVLSKLLSSLIDGKLSKLEKKMQNDMSTINKIRNEEIVILKSLKTYNKPLNDLEQKQTKENKTKQLSKDYLGKEFNSKQQTALPAKESKRKLRQLQANKQDQLISKSQSPNIKEDENNISTPENKNKANKEQNMLTPVGRNLRLHKTNKYSILVNDNPVENKPGTARIKNTANGIKRKSENANNQSFIISNYPSISSSPRAGEKNSEDSKAQNNKKKIIVNKIKKSFIETKNNQISGRKSHLSKDHSKITINTYLTTDINDKSNKSKKRNISNISGMVKKRNLSKTNKKDINHKKGKSRTPERKRKSDECNKTFESNLFKKPLQTEVDNDNTSNLDSKRSNIHDFSNIDNNSKKSSTRDLNNIEIECFNQLDIDEPINNNDEILTMTNFNEFKSLRSSNFANFNSNSAIKPIVKGVLQVTIECVEETLDINFESIASYLSNKDIISFLSVNKLLRNTAMSNLLLKIENEIASLKNKINILQDAISSNNEPPILSPKYPIFVFSQSGTRALGLLKTSNSKDFFMKYYNKTQVEVPEKSILFIYSIFFCLMKDNIYSLYNTKSKEFWEYTCKYFVEIKKDMNVGEIVEKNIKNMEFDNELIYNLYKLAYTNYDWIKPMNFRGESQSTAIFSFIIKDVIDFLGISTEKTICTPKKQYYLTNAILETRNKVLTHLNEINAKFYT